MPMPCPMTMWVRTCLGAIAGLAVGAGPGIALANGPQRNDQSAAVESRRQGALPVREIERRLVPMMRGAQYLVFDFDPGSAIYTLKFLRDGNVIWVDVDARTGQIIRRTGN